MIPESTACPKFRKLCPNCGKYYPDDMAVCIHDRNMLITMDWNYDSDGLEAWLARSRFYGSKHCLRCSKHFKRTLEPYCPDDGGQLERCMQVETEGPILEGKYRLKSYIGKGKLSQVYYAMEVASATPRIVKFLRPDLAQDEKTVKRYLEVARSAMALQHPNIIKTYSANIADGSTPYVVTQYLAGQSLRDELLKRSQLDTLSALNIFIELLRGLQYAHAHSVIHMNLTPSNIYIVQKGETDSAMIVDFGAAERLFRDVQWHGEQAAAETTNVYGDPLGICPEFCTGKRPTFLSDIYQVGCCLYEALNGRPPFLRKNALATMMAHAKEEPDQFEPTVHEALKMITLACLKKRPEERFQSVTELRCVLEQSRSEFASLPQQFA